MPRTYLAVIVVSLAVSAPSSAQPTKPLPDKRLGPPKTLNAYFPFTPPATREAWEKRREQVREQVLVANGLWPMPEKTPLKPVLHGKIQRDGYTIEKVFFASFPGHYVTGNLYRPTSGAAGQKRPAILSPHGHWANGRFYTGKDFENQLKIGAEQTKESAMYPLQARCAQLARMGCVVFHYDMVGYADSQQITHRTGFTDPEAELWLQSFMGLQTWNSIRALDFLLSLPDVDPKRVGVTGASGGGTQTFILCAIDDRPAAAFPAVMVSTAMQGGCVCENCSYLRVGTGNIELAALFAPKPLGMSGADDWTIDIETKGLPELKALYKLYGAEDNVMAKTYKQFKHNYNQVSRELMYNFFNKHLKLGQPEPVQERPFEPVDPKQLSVYDAEHPLPKDAVNADGLRRYLTMQSQKQLADLMPKDAKGLAEFRRVLGKALRAMVTDELPDPKEVEQVKIQAPPVGTFVKGKVDGEHLVISRVGQGEAMPLTMVTGPRFNGTVVVWVHPEGRASLWKDGQLVPAAQKIVQSGAGIAAPDVLHTGSLKAPRTPANKAYAGFTFGYNRPLLAERVHDILTTVAEVRKGTKVKKVQLVGHGEAGPWVLLASALCGDAVERTAADVHQFRFEQILSANDDMLLPGALKYGGLLTLAGLIAPRELYLHNAQGSGPRLGLESAYHAAQAGSKIRIVDALQSVDDVIAWLLR